MANVYYPVKLERTAAHRLPSKYAVLQRDYQNIQGQLEEVVRLLYEAADPASLGIVFKQVEGKSYGVSYQPPVDKLWLESPKEGRVYYHVTKMKTRERWDFERAVFADEIFKRKD